MRRSLALCLMVSLCGPAGAVDRQAAVSVGPGAGSPAEGGDSTCGALLFTADGIFEGGWAWQYAGIALPYSGAFAECYFDPAEVCAAVFHFTQAGYQSGQRMDVYLWDDQGGVPGAVRCILPGVDPGPINYWPTTSRHVVELPGGCCVDSAWWIGFWGDWPGEVAGWFIAADLNGGPWPRNGCPYTNIAPGVGYPTGWTNVETVWGPTMALGIGAEVVACEPTPVERTSWGVIKALYEVPRP